MTQFQDNGTLYMIPYEDWKEKEKIIHTKEQLLFNSAISRIHCEFSSKYHTIDSYKSKQEENIDSGNEIPILGTK